MGAHIKLPTEAFKSGIREGFEQFQQNIIRGHGHHVTPGAEISYLTSEPKALALNMRDQLVRVVGLDSKVMVRPASTLTGGWS